MYTKHFAKDGKKPVGQKEAKRRAIKLEGQRKKPAMAVLTTMAPEKP